MKGLAILIALLGHIFLGEIDVCQRFCCEQQCQVAT